MLGKGLFRDCWSTGVAATAWAGVLALGFCAAPAGAQLRIVNYNIAQLNGDLTALENVIAALNDDDKPGFTVPVSVFVLQEVQAADVAPLLNIINDAAPPGVSYVGGTFTSSGSEDGSGGAQAMFFRSGFLQEFVTSHADIPSGGGRNTDRWRMRLLGYATPLGPENTFWIYGSHLKADTGGTNENLRLQGAQAIRDNADALPAAEHVIYCGDFNLYHNEEPAYTEFLSPGNGQAFDPLGTGSWGGAGNAIKHSQAPCLSGCALVGGGMDDRFDFQLSSGEFADGEGLARMTGIPFGYRSLGNDGQHHNQAINNGNNFYYPGDLPRSNALADNLAVATDHVPVVVEYQLPALMAGSIAANFGRVIQGALHSLAIEVTNPVNVVVVNGADELDYTAVGSLGLSGVASDTVLPLGDVSNPSFLLNTSTVGALTGRVTLSATSPGAHPASIILESTGTIVRASNPSFSGSSDSDEHTVNQSYSADSGVHNIQIPVYNFGYDSLQALLDIDSIDGLSGPFAYLGSSPNSNIGTIPATLTFTFDSTGLKRGPYSATAIINTSDEDVPGQTASAIELTISVTIEGEPPAPCDADINADGFVNVVDLLAVIGTWGNCAVPGDCPSDLNGDGVVNVIDLLALIAAWGACD